MLISYRLGGVITVGFLHDFDTIASENHGSLHLPQFGSTKAGDDDVRMRGGLGLCMPCYANTSQDEQGWFLTCLKRTRTVFFVLYY